MEENITTMVTTALQHPQSPLQECAMITNQQNQAARQAFHTKQDVSKGEKYEKETNVYLKNVTVKASGGQEETTLASPSNDSELEDNETNNSGLEEMTRQESIRSPCQTCTDQLQVFLPTSEEGGGSYATFLEKQLVTKEISQCNLDSAWLMLMQSVRRQQREYRPKKAKEGHVWSDREGAASFFRHKSMKMGRMEKRVEKQIYNSNTVDLMVQEEMISSLFPFSPLFIPLHHIKEQSEAEIKLHSSDYGGDDKLESCCEESKLYVKCPTFFGSRFNFCLLTIHSGIKR